jgi:hypothetical protein
VTARQEGLVERHRPTRGDLDEIGDLALDGLKITNERKAGTIEDETARSKGGLDPLLDGIGRLACRAAHRPGRLAPRPPLARRPPSASARTARNPESSPR